MPVALLGMTAAKPDLAQFRPRFDADAEAAGRNLEPKLALVVERHLVERLSPIDDEAGENVDAASRALRVCGAGQVGSQLEALHQPGDVDDPFLQHGAFAGQRDRLRVQALEPVANSVLAPGQEARANTIGFLAEPQVETGRLKLRQFHRYLSLDQLPADHGPDLLPPEQAEWSREQGVRHRGFVSVEDVGKRRSARRQQFKPQAVLRC